MKKILKEIFLFFVDLVNFIQPLWRLTTIQRFRNEIKETTQEKPLYIIGNGPSAKEAFDFKSEKRQNVNLCTVNFAVLTDSFFEQKPELHFFADPHFFSHLEDERVKKVLENIEKKIDWNLNLFIPYCQNREFYKICQRNKKINIIQYPSDSWSVQGQLAKKIRMFFFFRGWFTPKLQNVIVACIFNAIHLGYKKIFLFGVEHSWLNDIFVDSLNQVCLLDRHFYGEKKIIWKDPQGKPIKIHNLLCNLSKTFLSYWELKDFAKKKGNIQIINNTQNSFIDAFERVHH